MTDKQINKWLRRRFSAIGWGLIGYFVILNILATMGIFWEVLRQMLSGIGSGRFPEPDFYAASNNAWGYILAGFVALIILDAWKGSSYWKQEIFAKQRKMSGKVFFCLLSLCIGAQMVNTLWLTGLETLMNLFDRSVLTMLESVSGSTDTLSMFLYASVAAPITEELIFRGYILRALRPYGKRFAIWGSALLFGLFHGNLLQTPYAILVGLVLGYVTVEYSISWAVGIHVFNNFVLAELMTRLTANLPPMVLEMLNLCLFGGFLVVSVCILIANRWDVQAYRHGEWMDRRVLKCFFTNSGILVLSAMMVVSMLLMLFV